MAEISIHHRDSSIMRHGAMAVVLSEDRAKVLLLRREIFILWDLPGGGIEEGEDPARAAERECREETGYEIKAERLVGLYRHQSVYGKGDQLTYVYLARVIGGVPKRWGLEITGLRWCEANSFPHGLQPLHRQMITDAAADSTKPVERWIKFPRWKLYPARLVFIPVGFIGRILRRLLHS